MSSIFITFLICPSIHLLCFLIVLNTNYLEKELCPVPNFSLSFMPYAHNFLVKLLSIIKFNSLNCLVFFSSYWVFQDLLMNGTISPQTSISSTQRHYESNHPALCILLRKKEFCILINTNIFIL